MIRIHRAPSSSLNISVHDERGVVPLAVRPRPGRASMVVHQHRPFLVVRRRRKKIRVVASGPVNSLVGGQGEEVLSARSLWQSPAVPCQYLERVKGREGPGPCHLQCVSKYSMTQTRLLGEQPALPDYLLPPAHRGIDIPLELWKVRPQRPEGDYEAR